MSNLTSSKAEMESKKANEVLLHQISLPARRDYQLRSSSLKADAKFSRPQLSVPQYARAISFNSSHEEVPFVIPHSLNQRAYYSGPLSSHLTAERSGRPDTVAGHVRERSQSDASFATADAESSLGQSDHLDFCQELGIRVAGNDSQLAMTATDKGALVKEPYTNNRRNIHTHSSTKFAGKEVLPVDGKSTWVLTPRRAVSGDLSKTSRTKCQESNIPNRRHPNRELALVAQEKPPVKGCLQSGAKVAQGASCGIRLGDTGAGDSRRRPTASIAWDSLNKSQENSPQHELAAVPFKWEDAPGKPKTIAAAAERAMARRLQKEGCDRISVRELQHRSVTAHLETSREEELGRGMLSSPNSSFRSSHRFYARTAAGERSFGPRSSVDSGHVISEVETEAHIDLVAPAAAKFLVESWVSPNVTPEPNLTTSIPFKWEEAPGKPKTDEASECKPPQLQLPPRLVVPSAPVSSVDSMSRELRGRQRTRSMSGPLAGYYPAHTSPARRRQQQQSPPVMRSCSPSKRSISPSKIQALAKHFSRKGSSAAAAPVDGPYENVNSWSAQPKNLRHSYTCGHNSGPLEEYRGSGAVSNRALARSASRALSEVVKGGELQDESNSWSKSHAKVCSAYSFSSGPLDSKAKSKRTSSPSKRSISPSRIHTLAKQLTCKIKPPPESCVTLEDPNWPIQVRQVRHSFTLGQTSNSGPLEIIKGAEPGAANEEYSLERMSFEPAIQDLSEKQLWSEKQAQFERDSWSPTSILQGPNDHMSQAHPSAPSSGSDMDTHSHTNTPPSIALSKSLSRVSYESFEQSLTEPASPMRCPPATEDAGASSPYLGPTSADYRFKDSSGGASEGVKAIMKLCRTGTAWRRSKTHSPEMWAPTLASYFQCLEATMSHPPTTQNEQQEGDTGDLEASSPAESLEAQTRLPYTMPSLVEQKLASREYCDSPGAEFSSCLGVRLSPARFISRGDNWSGVECAVTWSDQHLGHSTPTNNVEDGYRSPAYAATLELLSPSAELITKKKKNLGTSRSVKLVLPSSSMRRRTHFVEAMCKSLKRALYKCAKRCCRKTGKLQYNEEPVLPSTEFSFCKPN